MLSTLFPADKIEISPKKMNNKYENEWGFPLNTDRNSSIVFFLSTSRKLIRFKTAIKSKWMDTLSYTKKKLKIDWGIV